MLYNFKVAVENVPYNYFSTLLRLYILNPKGPKRRLSAKVRLASSDLLPPNNRLNTLRPGPSLLFIRESYTDKF